MSRGIDPNHPALAQARAKGLIAAEGLAPPAKAARGKPALVAAAYHAPGTWVVPVVTLSESNERSRWARASRTGAARRAVSRTLGPWLPALASFSAHYHAGFPLRVVFTRLGGRKLDRGNLPGALKACEDALCIMTGCDDGDPRWRAEWGQEPGGPCGVRIQISTEAA